MSLAEEEVLGSEAGQTQQGGDPAAPRQLRTGRPMPAAVGMSRLHAHPGEDSDEHRFLAR